MQTVIRDEVVYSTYTAIADDRGNAITYRELAQKADSLKEYIEKRSLLFFLCDHQMETVEFLYEILYINAVPLLLPEDIDAALLDKLLKIYEPQYLYCKSFRKESKAYRHSIELSDHVLLETGDKKYPIHPDVAVLLSTSGTTGSSKLVKLTYENLYDNAKYGCIHLDIRCGQKGLSPLPIHYAFGFSFCLWHWHCGATMLFTERPVLSREFQDLYRKERVDNFAATPYTYRMLERIQFWDQEKAGSLNFAISSGAYMPEKELTSLVSVLHDKFWIGYGQTECIGIVLATNFDEGDIKIGTVGKAFQNATVLLDQETDEMLIKSKSVCMGYAYGKEDLAGGDVNQGILHTGDVVSIERDGYIYLRGRLKRYVKILGKRVSLDDLSDQLSDRYPNVGFACTGEDDHILIYHTDPGIKADEEIRNLLDQYLKIPAKLIACIYLEEIPRNQAGKIAYDRLNGLGEKDKGKNEREDMEAL